MENLNNWNYFKSPAWKGGDLYFNAIPYPLEIGSNEESLKSISGIIEIACQEIHATLWQGEHIFDRDIPVAGDIFHIHITGNGYEYGEITGTYCDWGSPVWHNYHSGIDIGQIVMSKSKAVVEEECHVYPVRDGNLVAVRPLTDGGFGIVVQVGPVEFDWYTHVMNERFPITGVYTTPIPVYSNGIDATLLSASTKHENPHLHYAVYNDNEGQPSLGTKSVKNPLNDHLRYNESPIIPPAVISSPLPGISFRGDDHMITPIPVPFQSSEIHGKVDIEARMLDYNCLSCSRTGINQIGYYLFSGFGDNNPKHFRESRILLDSDTLCGVPGHPDTNEYSPFYFDTYNTPTPLPTPYVSIPYTTIYGKGPYPFYLMHNYFYNLTNNLDLMGGKIGISTEGSWDTEETILTPAGDAKKYPDGPYTVLVRGADIQGNWSDDLDPVNSRTITVLNNYSHILYVDDDSKLSGDLDDPFSSISEAMNYSSRGTLVFVAPGTYDSSIECFPIDIPEGVTVMGSGHEYSFIVGNSNTSVFRCTHPDAVLSGFTISRGGDDENQATVVFESTSAKIRDCRLLGESYTGTGLLFYWSIPGASVENCIIKNHVVQGIWCDHSNYADIINCIIDNNNFIGVYGGPSAWFDIANCILRSHTYALAAEYNSHITAHSSIFRSNTYDYYIALGSSIDFYSCYQANPMFVTAHGRNYYLDYSSPCVNYGIDIFVEDPQIYLKTTRVDNYCDPGTGLYDSDAVDIGFHYDPIVSTPTPYPTEIPSNTPLPTMTPTPIPTKVPGLGVVYLDSQNYFTEGDTAEILVWDADLNQNPSVAESYDVDITSDTIYPTTIPMTVMEISVDSEYFSTSETKGDLGFTTGPSVPYSLIQVSDSDSITVTYNDASPPGQRTDTASWYSAVPPTETPFPTMTPTTTPTMTQTPTTTPTAFPGAFYEDFESGSPGWVTDGLWHLTTTDSHSPTHSMWYGQEATGDYDTGGPNSGSLTSPPIHLESGYTTFTFWSREETDGTSYWDTRKIYISNDAGVSWDLLHQSRNNDNSWYQPRAIDLSGYTGELIQLRFEFDTVDAGDNQHLGWLIDDIAIDDSPLPIPSMNIIGKLLLLVVFFILMVVSGKKSMLRKE